MLVATGTIAVSQFWPAGGSDADTVNVQVERLTYDGRTTHAFDGAVVEGRVRREVVRHGELTVRLQGVDAPELQYGTDVPHGRNARHQQAHAEVATRELATCAGGAERRASARPRDSRTP